MPVLVMDCPRGHKGSFVQVGDFKKCHCRFELYSPASKGDVEVCELQGGILKMQGEIAQLRQYTALLKNDLRCYEDRERYVAEYRLAYDPTYLGF